MTILMLIFGRSDLYVNGLGFLALGLESTLPIPQFYRYASAGRLIYCITLIAIRSNFKQRSLYGFRASILIGWVAGDLFK